MRRLFLLSLNVAVCALAPLPPAAADDAAREIWAER
jgi:hypothetical protein